MRNSIAKQLRKKVRDFIKHGYSHYPLVAYKDETFKKPRVMKDDCIRAVYQKAKQEYLNVQRNG